MNSNLTNRPLDPPRTCPMNKKKYLWGLLISAAGIFSCVCLINWNSNPIEIQIMDLWKLIDQGPSQFNPKAAIEVREDSDDNELTYRYSQLDNLRIGPNEITGTVRRELIRPPSLRTKPENKVAFFTPRYGLENYSNAIFDLLIRKGFSNVRGEKAPSIWYNMLPMFVPLIPILLIVYYMMRQKGSGFTAAFSRSRGKLYARKDIRVTFSDVAGIDEAVEELREVVDFLKSSKKYLALGGRIPRGVLLVGPTGTGKTLLAKAIAGEADVPFFSLSGSDFVEMFAGVGAARVRDMFKQAQAKAPCIVFIDELDSLGKIRGSSMESAHDEREQTLNALLVEMDGFSSNNGVIIMAATNRPNMLDPALLRPGRFDRHVLVDRPDINGREKILQVHLQKVKIDKSVDIKWIAKITSGFVGADLANLVNEAALLAARANKSSISMLEFNEGVERLTSGLEKRQRVMGADEKKRFAFHESAHALVAFYLPNTDQVHKVSIIPRGLAIQDNLRPDGDHHLLTQDQLVSRIQVLLAGSVAEEMIFGCGSTSSKNDLERATEIARSMIMDYGLSRLGRIAYRDNYSSFSMGDDDFACNHSHSEQTAREIDEEIRSIINVSMEKVRQVLEDHKGVLATLAERLIEKEVIGAAELKEVTESERPNPANIQDPKEAVARPFVPDSTLPFPHDAPLSCDH
jgi:cell division protease FtsH